MRGCEEDISAAEDQVSCSCGRSEGHVGRDQGFTGGDLDLTWSRLWVSGIHHRISEGLSGFTLGIRVILGVGVSKGYRFITVGR